MTRGGPEGWCVACVVRTGHPDSGHVDVDSSRVTKFKQVGDASGSSKLLLQMQKK